MQPKDRPVKVLEQSPRGKVLSVLYSEAVRRSGSGQGVPSGVVTSLTSQTVRENQSALHLMQTVLKADVRPSTALDLQHFLVSPPPQ